MSRIRKRTIHLLEKNRPLVIVNPAAGGGHARGFWRHCAAACAHLSFEVVETQRRGDAADYAAAAGDRLGGAGGGGGPPPAALHGPPRPAAAPPPPGGVPARGPRRGP